MGECSERREEKENVVAVEMCIRYLIGKGGTCSDRSKEKVLRDAAAAFKEEISSLIRGREKGLWLSRLLTEEEEKMYRERKKEDALFWKQMVSEDVLASHNVPAGVDDSDSSYFSDDAQV